MIQTLKEARLPLTVRSRLQACLEDLTTFWRHEEQTTYWPLANFTGVGEAFSTFFHMALDCDKSCVWNVITSRFLMLFFYDLKTLHNVKSIRDPRLNILETLGASSMLTTDEMEKRYSDWSARGFKYFALVSRFGAGVLFYLPQRIPSTT